VLVSNTTFLDPSEIARQGPSREANGWEPNDRGVSYTFGATAVEGHTQGYQIILPLIIHSLRIKHASWPTVGLPSRWQLWSRVLFSVGNDGRVLGGFEQGYGPALVLVLNLAGSLADGGWTSPVNFVTQRTCQSRYWEA